MRVKNTLVLSLAHAGGGVQVPISVENEQKDSDARIYIEPIHVAKQDRIDVQESTAAELQRAQEETQLVV